MRRADSIPVIEEVDGNWSSHGPEPMSALLRRRAEDWSIRPTVNSIESSVGSVRASSAGMDSLNVTTEKVVKLLGEDEEGGCPSSPKRPSKEARRSKWSTSS